jgi:hypothetical protein
MSNGGGSKRNRGGGGGGNQQRRRRSGGSGNRPQAPTGPAMTALGESTYEAVFDHGGNGYGVWFDGVVRDDPMYKQFWKGTGTRPLYVRIEEDRIVLLKQLDRELPPLESADAGGAAAPAGMDDADVDAAIEEAVAEAMAAAGAATEEAETVYSPEEAAALFAAGGEGDAAAGEAAEEADEEPEAKPKKRVTRKKAAPKATEE